MAKTKQETMRTVEAAKYVGCSRQAFLNRARYNNIVPVHTDTLGDMTIFTWRASDVEKIKQNPIPMGRPKGT